MQGAGDQRGRVHMENETMSFEESIRRLEEIVRSLEQGETTLSDSLKLYEEGAALLSRCSEMLDNAEQRVVKLRKGADGKPEELPFES